MSSGFSVMVRSGKQLIARGRARCLDAAATRFPVWYMVTDGSHPPSFWLLECGVKVRCGVKVFSGVWMAGGSGNCFVFLM